VKTTPSKQRQQQQQDISRVPAAAADTAKGVDQARQSQQQQVLPQGGAGLDPTGAAAGAQGFRHMPEYLVAWELEVWRKVRRTWAFVALSFQGSFVFISLPGDIYRVSCLKHPAVHAATGICSSLTR
jgi:hypothetical protein